MPQEESKAGYQARYYLYEQMGTDLVFGENLPDRFFKHLSDFSRAQVLLVMGTSLVVRISHLTQVNPFASLIDEVPTDCPRYLLNLDRVGERASNGYLSVFGYDNASGFDFSENSRDKFCQGKVDDIVRSLARKCGWEVSVQINTKGELNALYKKTYEQISARNEFGADTQAKGAELSESTAIPLLNETEELAKQLSSTHLAARTDSP
ncbi:Sir2 histone deacetylase Hst2 [Malassezia yamatoensis]|uniref:Sir2 histone deacetylase Hst2 n=1 Tax=Malassezia yamatoensis TaxID=253288 RepID=A0AAJ5YS08_9BASI|nr:Sir2 histone deacetylase Hst2 [Malassezia yamatoensis]